MKFSNNESASKRDAGNLSNISFQEMTRILRDPVIIRVVTIVDITSLSVLELLEYGLSRDNVRYAFTKGVISFVWAPPYASEYYRPLETTDVGSILLSDEAYRNSLRSKVALTKLGLFLLDCIKGRVTDEQMLDKARELFNESEFRPPTGPHK